MVPRKRQRSLIRYIASSIFGAMNMKRTLPGTLLVVLVLLLAQAGGRAQSVVSDPLKYANGFLVTGNYVVGGVDLTKDVNVPMGGFATGVINISGVPANADILAAYLYWETIDLT